jgi:hypothetical protein
VEAQKEIIEEVAEESIEEQTEENAEPSLRDTLESAIETHETTSEEETPPEEETKAEVPAQEAESDTPPEPVEPAKTQKSSPPVGWAPAVKEKWNDLPDEVRESITTREREMAQNYEQNADARRLSEGFIRTMEPWQQLMASEGVQDPFQAITGLMQVTAELKMGTPQQKAQRLAGLVSHYGIDIEMLDQALTNQLPQENAPPQDPRIDQLYNYVQQMEAQRQDAVGGQANQLVAEFAKTHEFMDDPRFRNTMADHLDVAKAHGRSMSMEEAHAAAMASLPEYQAVLEQRKLVAGNQTVQKKRQAATSISGHQGGNMSKSASGNSIRDALLDAWEDPGRI